MKRFYALTTSIVFLLAILITSNASGPANNGNRATGAPGDGGNTCITCHNNTGGFGSVSIEFEMTDDNDSVVDAYEAEAEYSIKVTVNHTMGTPAGYGFSMIAIQDDNEDALSGWDNESSNARISTANNRKYVEHDGMSTTNEFTVDWTAPEAGTGDVTFYLGANAVNNNSASSGDRSTLDDFTFEEIVADTIPNTVAKISNNEWGIFPNPVGDVIYAKRTNESVQILSSNGVLIKQARLDENGMDVSDLPSGFYFLKAQESNRTEKFFKL